MPGDLSHSKQSGIDSLVVGSPLVGGCLASVLSSLYLSDDGLVEQEIAAKTGLTSPLIHLKFVMFYCSPHEPLSLLRWRLHQIWHLYGEYGGRDRRAEGLRILIYGNDVISIKEDLANRAVEGKKVVDQYLLCQWEAGIKGILDELSKCSFPIHFLDWHDEIKNSHEVSVRKKIGGILNIPSPTSSDIQQIKHLGTTVSPLAWEDFCPPPNPHRLANRIRHWLTMTGDVIPFIEEGRTLYSKLRF